MKLKSLLLLASLTCASSAAGQAQFIDVTALSGQTVFSISDITPDGRYIVGNASGGGYIWDWQNDPSPTIIGGLSASGVSDDGAVVTGNITDPQLGVQVAGRWTLATGWQSIGFLPNALNCPSKSSAYDITGDGTTIVGLSWDGCSGRGFRWTQATGMQELQVLINGGNRASKISADGSAIVGFAQSSTRSPAIWLADTTGQAYDPAVNGECRGVSDDGSVVVGTWDQQAFYHDGTTLTQFGTLFSGWIGAATDISESGARICGYDFQQLSTEAWVWSESTGIERLSSKLQNLGVAGVPASLGACSKMTPDGGILVGQTTFVGAWIVILPPEVETYCVAKTTSIGCVPEVGFIGGPASASAPTVFDVTANSVDGQRPGLMFFGFNAAAVPFNGGTLCVQPPLARTGIQFSNGMQGTCTGSYTYDFQGLIQGGTNPFLTVGSDVYAQYWFRDQQDVFGVGLTNALTFQIAP